MKVDDCGGGCEDGIVARLLDSRLLGGDSGTAGESGRGEDFNGCDGC